MSKDKRDLINKEVFVEDYEKDYIEGCNYGGIYTFPVGAIGELTDILNRLGCLRKYEELGVDQHLIDQMQEIQVKTLNYTMSGLILHVLILSNEMAIDVNHYLKGVGVNSPERDTEFQEVKKEADKIGSLMDLQAEDL